LFFILFLKDFDFIEEFKVYKPIVDTSQFWLLSKDYILLEKNETEKNESDEFINITISFNTYWSMKYIMQIQMQSSFSIYSDYGLMDTDSGMEEMKEMLTETNVYLLGVTMVVSFLHSIFEILVLKNGKFFNKNNFIFHIFFLNTFQNQSYNFGKMLNHIEGYL